MEPAIALDLAERQHSMVATYQLRDAGLTSQVIWRMRRSDDWEALSSQVLARRGAERTQFSRLMAGVLDAGPSAFLSGPASAALWKVSSFGLLHLRNVDASRPRGGSRRPTTLARVHEVRDLEPDHVTRLHGIPVSTPTRMVFELAASVHPARAERALDNVWSRNLTNRRLVEQMLDDWADRGRNGTAAMREILERRPAGYVPPASNLESRFAYLAEKHDVGPFRRQINLGGEAWIGRVDFLHQRGPLVVEVLSEAFHAALFAQEADDRRFAMLDEVGYEVEPVWDHELWGNPGPAMDRVRAAERRLLGFRAA